MKEIGSEFCFDNEMLTDNSAINDFIYSGNDFFLTFSGRTAIDLVITDIKKTRTVSNVLFPSYCCKSMLTPFEDNNIQIQFYNVDFSQTLLDFQIPDDCNIVFLCNYFGYRSSYNKEALKRFQRKGGIVIEDITHSFLSYEQHLNNSDYIIASLRKWGGLLCGGFCSKKNGFFSVNPTKKPTQQYLEIKKQAMINKAKYINGDISIDKQDFLDMFSQANSMLANDYKQLLIDDVSKNALFNWDVNKIRTRRIDNAKILHAELDGIPGINLLFPIEKADCPLFVPIIVHETLRDALRKILIENNIYCPVHWPLPHTDLNSNIYKTELSLICDQRYTEQDMYFMVDIIKKFVRCNL